MIILDIECYPNYYLIALLHTTNGSLITYSVHNNVSNGSFPLFNETIITFNGINYDIPILSAIKQNHSNAFIYKMSTDIINNNLMSWNTYTKYSIPNIIETDNLNHIDLMQVAPLVCGLKLYGARMHIQHLQNIPIEPNSIISKPQIVKLESYCINDLKITLKLYKQLLPQLEVRKKLSSNYKIDLRSKSDAQISEAVIRQKFKQKTHNEIQTPSFDLNKICTYSSPKYIKFKTKELQNIQKEYSEHQFTLQKNGALSAFKRLITIGDTAYKCGVGGIHSCEKSIYYKTNKTHFLLNYDVVSYYPSIILNNRYFPPHIGPVFLDIYKNLVENRIQAKRVNDKITSDALKIVINGAFGKLSNKWSLFYSPETLLHVTVTGQLSLLMLIEQLHLADIKVISANTDGIVIWCNKPHTIINKIIYDWEDATGHITEWDSYNSLASKDVNNYIATTPTGVKGKGAYTDRRNSWDMLRSNPVAEIIGEALRKYLKYKTSIEDTITNCKDITKFLVCRTVNGGAIYNGKKLGKVVRWYYTATTLRAIRYITNNNMVPLSRGSIPIMDLTKNIPDNLDHNTYINIAYKSLTELGVML